MIKVLFLSALTFTLGCAGPGAAYAASPADESMKAEAKVSESDAQNTALAKVSHGTVKSSELEREHGRLIWSLDIATPGSSSITEVNVDAVSGAIVAMHAESPAREKAEAAAEHKEETKVPAPDH